MFQVRKNIKQFVWSYSPVTELDQYILLKRSKTKFLDITVKFTCLFSSTLITIFYINVFFILHPIE